MLHKFYHIHTYNYLKNVIFIDVTNLACLIHIVFKDHLCINNSEDFMYLLYACIVAHMIWLKISHITFSDVWSTFVLKWHLNRLQVAWIKQWPLPTSLWLFIYQLSTKFIGQSNESGHCIFKVNMSHMALGGLLQKLGEWMK